MDDSSNWTPETDWWQLVASRVAEEFGTHEDRVVTVEWEVNPFAADEE